MTDDYLPHIDPANPWPEVAGVLRSAIRTALDVLEATDGPDSLRIDGAIAVLRQGLTARQTILVAAEQQRKT
ncbi:MAG: hypothetical protein IT198_16355 [Acidimicrobiia bacterium]|nr:hypothetical protein [Acidimicrobiia bacterium]